MSYQVLARKWRPRTFAELVGQSHVVRPLVNALDHNRLHHAFLFAGTRGVGKTTLARILAKSLNCETGVTSTPCGKCSACVEVDEGRFIDLIEVDAASRTKVEDTRELLENVQYAPSRGRYKVYLIDEVHMLSGHSFNALLKTLEEPPPHVKFLLATTDPQRLPVTVLSRCLQFNLKRLSVDEIAAQLEKILAAENIEYDAPSVRLLARGADGSMRDGLSLLDQAIAFGGGRVAASEVRTMLGSIDQNVVARLLAGLAANDAAVLLGVVAEVIDHGTDAAPLLDELLLALHRIALMQTDPALVDERDADSLRAHVAALSAQDVQLYYQIGLIGRRDLPLAPDTRVGVEMTLLRMLAFRPVVSGAEAELSPPPARKGATPSETRSAPARVGATATAASAASPAAPDYVNRTVPPQDTAGENAAWAKTVEQLAVNGLVKELASNTSLDFISDGAIGLVLAEPCAKLLNKEREVALKQALEGYYGHPLRLTVRIGAPPMPTPMQQKMREQSEAQQAAAAAIDGDPNVRALREQFNARVNPDSIRPVATASDDSRGVSGAEKSL